MKDMHTAYINVSNMKMTIFLGSDNICLIFATFLSEFVPILYVFYSAKVQKIFEINKRFNIN